MGKRGCGCASECNCVIRFDDGTYPVTEGNVTILPAPGNTGTDSLVANADGSFTHTAVDGTVTVIPAPGTDSLAINPDGTVTHTAVDGTVTIVDVCAIVEANCPSGSDSLVANADGSFTHTAVDGTVTVIPAAGTDSLVANADGSYTHTAVDGTVTTIAAPAAGGNSSVVDNGDGTFTHTSGDGTATTLDVCALIGDGECTDSLVANADGSFTHTALDGTVVVIPAPAAGGSDSLVINADGSITHTAVNGTAVTFDVCAIVEANCSDSLVANVDGSFTHTAVDGTVTVIPATALNCNDVRECLNFEYVEYDPAIHGPIDNLNPVQGTGAAGGPWQVPICCVQYTAGNTTTNNTSIDANGNITVTSNLDGGNQFGASPDGATEPLVYDPATHRIDLYHTNDPCLEDLISADGSLGIRKRPIQFNSFVTNENRTLAAADLNAAPSGTIIDLPPVTVDLTNPSACEVGFFQTENHVVNVQADNLGAGWVIGLYILQTAPIVTVHGEDFFSTINGAEPIEVAFESAHTHLQGGIAPGQTFTFTVVPRIFVVINPGDGSGVDILWDTLSIQNIGWTLDTNEAQN